jgi:hypothetical protein
VFFAVVLPLNSLLLREEEARKNKSSSTTKKAQPALSERRKNWRHLKKQCFSFFNRKFSSAN